MNQTEISKQTSPLLIAAAWLVVVIPAGWGLRYTVQNALKLFVRADTPMSAPVAPAAH